MYQLEGLCPGLAINALKAKSEVSDDSISLTCVIYCHTKNPKEIYYQFDEPEAAPKLATVLEGPTATVADEPLIAVP